MATLVIKKCENCKKEIHVRAADVRRGWGRFCSKSCKAIAQERRTGQMQKYLRRKERRRIRAEYRAMEEYFHPLDPYCTGED